MGTASMPGGSPVVALVCNMQELFKSFVQRHVKLAGGGGGGRLCVVSTSLLAEEVEAEGAPSRARVSSGVRVVYPSCDHAPLVSAGVALDTRTVAPPGHVELHRRATNEEKCVRLLWGSSGKDHSGAAARQTHAPASLSHT